MPLAQSGSCQNEFIFYSLLEINYFTGSTFSKINTYLSALTFRTIVNTLANFSHNFLWDLSSFFFGAPIRAPVSPLSRSRNGKSSFTNFFPRKEGTFPIKMHDPWSGNCYSMCEWSVTSGMFGNVVGKERIPKDYFGVFLNST